MTTTSRRIAANRRRWANPAPILRYSRTLTPEIADVLRARWLEAVRHRRPILVGDDFEVIR